MTIRYIARRPKGRLGNPHFQALKAGSTQNDLNEMLEMLGPEWIQAIPRDLVKRVYRCPVNGDGCAWMVRRYFAFGRCVGTVRDNSANAILND